MRVVPRDKCSQGSNSRLNKLEEGTLETKISFSIPICFEITQQISLKQSASRVLNDVPG
jgi:hypothetical protein